jgi:hypothetical protein
MEANPPKARIPQTAARQFWWCGPVLNLPKEVFSIRIRPLTLTEFMLSQKLLVDVGIDTFTSEN